MEVFEMSFWWRKHLHQEKVDITCGIDPETRAYVGKAYFHGDDFLTTIHIDGSFEHRDGTRFRFWLERVPRKGRSRQFSLEVERWESLSVAE